MLVYNNRSMSYIKIITPRACAARGKAIGSVCLSVVNTKIARSRDLGIWATRKCNKSVEVVEKLAPLCFKSFSKAHERRKTGVFIGHAYQPHPLVFSAHAHNPAEYVGKGRQPAHLNHHSSHLCSDRCTALQDADAARGICALESSNYCYYASKPTVVL